MKDIDNRYYTPEISEFYVGFEYELAGINEFNDEIYWNKWFFGQDFEHYEFDEEGWSKNIKNRINKNAIRVKLLDREDIEDLGFSQSNLSDSVFLYKEKVSLLPHLPKTTVGLNFNEGIPHVLIYYVPDEKAVPAGVNLFVGKIKNKSELKRLLRQLGIW